MWKEEAMRQTWRNSVQDLVAGRFGGINWAFMYSSNAMEEHEMQGVAGM
jgi:hypothetical protein